MNALLEYHKFFLNIIILSLTTLLIHDETQQKSFGLLI